MFCKRTSFASSSDSVRMAWQQQAFAVCCMNPNIQRRCYLCCAENDWPVFSHNSGDACMTHWKDPLAFCWVFCIRPSENLREGQHVNKPNRKQSSACHLHRTSLITMTEGVSSCSCLEVSLRDIQKEFKCISLPRNSTTTISKWCESWKKEGMFA